MTGAAKEARTIRRENLRINMVTSKMTTPIESIASRNASRQAKPQTPRMQAADNVQTVIGIFDDP
jgi:hypothetical protein